MAECSEGKGVGLALSGGGFRAAFFHIGVLARLAEIGVLPKVEVISTVSGGSIVGALYYVCLKRRLEEMPEGGIGKEGYLDLVAEVESQLRRGAQKNIRTRAFANPLKNAKMLLSPRYSRSDRIGDLYDRYIYKDAWGEPRDRKWSGYGPQRQIALRELKISPRGEGVDDPDAYNRDHGDEKLPVLLLNATSLNSGHNWRFEAIRMGESLPKDPNREAIANTVDKNMRLEPGYFEKKPRVPEGKRDFPLALAVAASAAVPGVFQPLAISDMYEGVRVQLVDGGVQDNQGLQGLLDSSCERLIVSDASGQMVDQEHPSARLLGVLARSASIEGDRIRDEQLLVMLGRESGRGALMHLRMGLDGKAIFPIGTPPKTERKADCATSDFGVDADIQDALSRIRTDLDFFGDTEASSLELDAYLMSGFELSRNGFAGEDEMALREHRDWIFRDADLETDLRSGDPTTLAVLRAGKRKFLRRFSQLPRGVRWATQIVLVLALAAALCTAWSPIADLLDEQWTAGAVLLVALLATVLSAAYALDPRSTLARIVLTPPLLLVAVPFAFVAGIAAIPIFFAVSLSEWARKASLGG
jgi:NTE family protein